MPPKPFNITFDSITSNSFRDIWEAPKVIGEFDKYQVLISTSEQEKDIPRTIDTVNTLEFNKGLESGNSRSENRFGQSHFVASYCKCYT